MYTIIKMVSDKRQISLWNKIKAWFLRKPINQEPFLELSYDPSSGYLFFADNNTYFKQNSINYKKDGHVKVNSNGTTRTWSLNELFAEGLNEDYKEE